MITTPHWMNERTDTGRGSDVIDLTSKRRCWAVLPEENHVETGSELESPTTTLCLV